MPNKETKSWRDLVGAQYFTHRQFSEGLNMHVRVVKVDVKEVEPEEWKPVLYFEGFDKPLILNVTNCMNMEWVSGTEDIRQWKGSQLTLYKDVTTYEGSEVPCVRIKPYNTRMGTPDEKNHADALQEFEQVGKERYKEAWDERKQTMVHNYMKAKLGVEDVKDPEKIGAPALQELTDMMLEAATAPKGETADRGPKTGA